MKTHKLFMSITGGARMVLMPARLTLLLLALVVSLSACEIHESDPVAPDMLSLPMPEFALPMLWIPEGTASDWDFRGQVTLLNVFGSKCDACEEENPIFMALVKRNDIQQIGITWRDTREAAITWLEKVGDPYSRIAFDEDGELAAALGITGPAVTFVVGRDGRIRYKHVGPMTQDIMEKTILPILMVIAKEKG